MADEIDVSDWHDLAMSRRELLRDQMQEAGVSARDLHHHRCARFRRPVYRIREDPNGWERASISRPEQTG